MKHFTFIILLTLIFTSCTKERLTGNGDVVSVTRNTRDFSGVRSSGSTRIHINYGTEFKVEVRGSSNLIPNFKTRVINNILEVGYENVWNVRRDDIEVYLTMPEVTSVSMSGSGRTTIAGAFPATNSFRVSLSGSGQVEVMDQFDCQYLSASVSGSGKAKLRSVISNDAEAKISGSGGVWLTALNQLRVRISGSGNVYYEGNPEIEEEISGSGDVRPL